MKKYYFFDLDGTLTDPALGITNSFKHAYRHFGMEIPSYEKLCTFIGPPLVTTFKKELNFDDEKTKEGVKAYREYFSTKGIFENKVYDGIPQLLKNLKAKGKTLVVATSKPEEFAVRIIDHFGLSEYFTYVCGSCMDETRSTKAEVIKYALVLCGIYEAQKEQVLMIGDRSHDIVGAKENGIESCGVLFGYGSREELEQAGADYIADSVAALDELSNRI
ncbi:MAG: HAD family hydrolase [Spirochaetaceae bacterium]|nr:HAD family hydrolase [Spirochaetaceae bacterium]